MIRITSRFFPDERGEKRDPISGQFFPLFCFVLSSLCSASHDWGGGEQSVSTTWWYHPLICIGMQMFQVPTELLRLVISIGVRVCVCSLLLCYLLQYLGHCFCRLCSLSDGYVLYSKPDAYAAWAKLFMILQAVWRWHTRFTLRGCISLCHWLIYFYVVSGYFLFISNVFLEPQICVLCLTYSINLATISNK